MSRGQQGQVFQTGQQQNKQAFGNEENSYNLAQTDIGNYEQQLGRYAAENPYTAGGEYQSQQKRVLANTADAMATGAGARLQALSARTGQNPAAAISATEAMQQANERALAGQEASAEEQRIQGEAGYNRDVLSATAAPVGMETSLARQQGEQSQASFGEEEQAAKTPSFLESLESQLASAGESFVGGLGAGMGKH